jgi:uncharacterized repeat protein (TIGR03803 family)
VDQWSWRRDACAVFLLLAATVIPLHAQTFTTLVNFNGTNGTVLGGLLGIGSASPLVWGADGNIYGTTEGGGTQGGGTVFQMTPAGTLTTLYGFGAITLGVTTTPDGTSPYGGLVQATDGSFYGITSQGGGGGPYPPKWHSFQNYRRGLTNDIVYLHPFRHRRPQRHLPMGDARPGNRRELLRDNHPRRDFRRWHSVPNHACGRTNDAVQLRRP